MTIAALASLESLQKQAGELQTGINDAIGRVEQQLRPGGGQTSHAIQQTMEQAKGITGGFRNFGQFATAVRAVERPGAFRSDVVQKSKQMIERWGQEYENRKNESMLVTEKANSPTGMNESFSGADGGYLIPPQFLTQVLMRTYANDIMSRCTVIPIASNSIKIPAINETSRADGSRFGGVRAYWRREAGTVTATKPSVKDISLDVDSLMLFIRATQELLEDGGGALEVFLNTVASQEMAFVMGDSIVNGDGVGKPLGIMNSQAKIIQAAVSGQGAGTIVSANVLAMWSRLHASCMPNAIWLMDQSTIPALSTMTIGTAGAQLAVYLPPGGLAGQQLAPYGTLLGRPIIPTEFGKQLGTEGDLILWDPTTYLVATRGGIASAVSMHLYFDSNEMAYRFTVRFDGKPWWLNALTPKSGGPTQSCIVTLSSTRT